MTTCDNCYRPATWRGWWRNRPGEVHFCDEHVDRFETYAEERPGVYLARM